MRSRVLRLAFVFLWLLWPLVWSTAAHSALPDSSLSNICTTQTGSLPVAKARLLAYGGYRGLVVSRIPEAQQFFDQGLVFGWGFNFAEAVRSFRAAAQLDPACALCRWGIAWALGPSINHDMEPANVPAAVDAIVQARSNTSPGSRDRALIDALATRYSDQTDADPEQLGRSYARAMRTVAQQFPADADLAVLAAEAAMNVHAYDYWHADGRPKPWTPEIVASLDRALSIVPDHPGAHHYRIHLFEESRQPERALASAEAIGTLAPMVGHLVHMPSHIFFRLGRYQDAVAANQAAVNADREYTAATGAESDYALHSLHFLWASALWAGDAAAARRAADRLEAVVAAMPQAEASDAMLQLLLAAPLLTSVRLDQWDAIDARVDPLQQSGPKAFLRALTQFAHGMAYAARGDVAAADAALASLQGSAREVQRAGLTVKSINQASAVLSVARSLLQSAIATARGQLGNAVRHARAAVLAEDRLNTDDPPVWVVPARHALGAALMRAGRAAEAERVYRADLQRFPQNAVALAGLAAAERKLRSSRVSFLPPAQMLAHPAPLF